MEIHGTPGALALNETANIIVASRKKIRQTKERT